LLGYRQSVDPLREVHSSLMFASFDDRPPLRALRELEAADVVAGRSLGRAVEEAGNATKRSRFFD
jgi:hypothetical protein